MKVRIYWMGLMQLKKELVNQLYVRRKYPEGNTETKITP